MLNPIGTYTLTIRHKFNQTDREVFESTLEAALSSGDVLELKSTQDIDKYADFMLLLSALQWIKPFRHLKTGVNPFRKNHLR